MAIDNSFLVKKILARDQVIAAFCGVTGMPFAVCDPVSFEDQIWVFSDVEQFQEFAKRYAGHKVPLQSALIKKASFFGFFASLYSLGISEVVFTENGASAKIPLDQIVKRQDLSGMPLGMRPLENPQLQLTGLYLMQEIGRQVPNEEKEDLQQLDEEFSVNLARARFAVAVEVKDGPGTLAEKLNQQAFTVPVVNLKNGDVYRPLFTDVVEFNKFRRDKKYQLLQVPFAGLKAMLPRDAKGYILNPAGYHILLQSAVIDRVASRFPDEVRQGAEELKKLQETLAGPQVKRAKVTQMPKTDPKD